MEVEGLNMHYIHEVSARLFNLCSTISRHDRVCFMLLLPFSRKVRAAKQYLYC